jgi:tetratricopeptide (TPR) repeat protein
MTPPPRPLVLLWYLLPACVSSPPHPRSVEQVRRGYAHLAAGDRERAEVAFEHALEMAPDLPEARAGLGVALRAGGSAALALEQFDASVAADPELAEGHAGRGEALLALGAVEAGEDAIAESLRLDPDQVPARLVRSRHLSRRAERATGDARRLLLDRARRDLLHALEARPGLAIVHHDLAWVSWLQGDVEGAAGSYARAAALDPSMAEAWLGACASLAASGREAEADEACARCVREGTPGSAPAARCASRLARRGVTAQRTPDEKRAPARTGAP